MLPRHLPGFALFIAALTAGCGGWDTAPSRSVPMDPPPQPLAAPVRIQVLPEGPVLLARGEDRSLLRARWEAGRWTAWRDVGVSDPSFGHAADPTLVSQSLVTGLAVSEDLGASFRRIGGLPPSADHGLDEPARAGVQVPPARDGLRVAACIASRSDTPEPLWLRTSADLGITWGRPVRVPGIWSRDRGAFSERQLAAAVIGDRIVVAGLVQDQRDLVLTVAEATATAGAIAWRGPPRQLRIADRPWAALLLWADDRGATVVLGYNGLEVVPVAEGQPLTLRRIVVPGHRVPDVDLMRLATGALAIAWSDDRHGSRMGLPLPLPISRPQSDHEDVHVGILSADGTLRTIQASTTGGHAHAPVLGHLDGQAVVLWAEHPLRESRNVTGSRGAATAIRMRPLD